MRIPETFFPLINFGMRLTLHSPLHFVVSRSILLLTFTERRSGQRYTIPVRYMQVGDVVRLFSSPHANWWRNLRDGSAVERDDLPLVGADHYAACIRANQEANLATMIEKVKRLTPDPRSTCHAQAIASKLRHRKTRWSYANKNRINSWTR